MGNSRKPSGGSRGGRAKGTPNKNKTELRVLTQEAVHEFTMMKRQEIAEAYRKQHNKTIPPLLLDSLQPEIQEYDPVVALSVIAADYSQKIEIRRQANADAAQFLRPKLKSIELVDDPRNQELQDQKNQLASRMVDILEAMAKAKKEQGH